MTSDSSSTGEKAADRASWQDARDDVYSLVARLADNKQLLGRHYADWCSGAPTLESAVAAAAMAQDELGHARALYPLLRTLSPQAGPDNEPETRTHYTNLSFLDHPFGGWEDFVAANFLVDNALSTIFAAATSSSYEPLAGRSRKVLQEERLHAQHAEAWVRRLAREGGAVRAACESSLRRAWTETLCWFGPQGASDPLSAAHVLDATPDELRARFLAIVGPTILAENLQLPLRQSGDGSWSLGEPLPWDRWDVARYRFATADSDAPVQPIALAGLGASVREEA
jgi:phenylacetate-CoA oxygenase PaaI subunit